jgi:integrase
VVREWHARTATDTPTMRAHAYMLLRTICAGAVADDLLVANLCRIRGAGQARRASKSEPASLEELAVIVDAMPERYRLMVLLATWCGLRFAELTDLRGHDIDTRRGVIKLRRAVVSANGAAVVTTPKSHAGSRDIAIAPHILPAVREHLLRHGVGREGLLFPAAHDPDGRMRPAPLTRVWYPAREKAGRPDLRFHDLRHSGLTLAAQTGATLAELMQRAGHSTPAAAMRYQHAAKGRDAEIAAALSKLASDADLTHADTNTEGVDVGDRGHSPVAQHGLDARIEDREVVRPPILGPLPGGYPMLNPAVNGLPSPTVVVANEGDSDVAGPNPGQVSHD